MRWTPITAVVVALLPRAASAQINDTGSGIVPIAISDMTPSGVNCNNPNGTSCIPLNKDACSNTTRLADVVQVTLGQPSVAPLASHLFIWIQKVTSSTTAPLCSKSSSTTNQVDIDRYDVAFDTWPTSPTSLAFPSSFNRTGQDDTVTLGDFMNGFSGLTSISDPGSVVTNACGSTGKSQVYALCFGVDYRQASGTLFTPDNQVDYSIEPTAWVRIIVDTVPPEDPSAVSAEAFDGRIVVTPTVATTPEAGDLWFVAARPLAAGASPSLTDCRGSDWATAKTATGDAINATTVTVDGLTNGTEYEGCIALTDQVGNKSLGWKSFTATPTDQCDFIECYPSDLKTGYCAGTGPAPLAAVLALLLLRRARKQEVRS